MPLSKIDPLYDLKVNCLLCGATYTTKRVRSRFSYAYKTDSDFCPYYRSEHNPLYYFVSVCPQCGFAQTRKFAPISNTEVRKRLEENITKKWVKQDYGRVRSFEQAESAYKLGILSGSLKQEKHSIMAGLCLRLAWLYRQHKKEKEEQRFLQLAVKEYEQAYTLSDFEDSSMSEMKVIYLIGELYRRTKQFEQAVSYFSMVVEHKYKELEPGLVRLAREQWQLTREEYHQARNLAAGDLDQSSR